MTLERVKLGLFQDSGLGLGFTGVFGLMFVHSTKYSELFLTRECKPVCAEPHKSLCDFLFNVCIVMLPHPTSGIRAIEDHRLRFQTH